MKIEFHEKQIAALNALAIDSDIKQVLYGGGVGGSIQVPEASLVVQNLRSCD
jgi:hypothetical protein